MFNNSQTIAQRQFIARCIGSTIILVGFVILLPAVLIIFFPDELKYISCFLIPSISSFVIGAVILLLIGKKSHGAVSFRPNQDFSILLILWIIAALIGAFPFLLSGTCNTFTQALFESVSGFSTTGFGIIDVDTAPKTIIFYKTILQLFGGVGLMLILTSLLSSFGSGMSIFSAEGHRDKLTPNLFHSARTILCIYLSLILCGILLYYIFGMSLFDATCYAISSVATGGFSPHAEGISYYESTPIYLVTVALMLLGATNFLSLLMLLQGKVRSFFSHCEVRFAIFIVVIMTPVFAIAMYKYGLFDNIPETIVNSLFHVTAVLTTTGYQTVPIDFNLSCALIFVPLLFLTITGGGTNSTACGVKLYRILLCFKNLFWNIRKTSRNRNIEYPEKINKFGKIVNITASEKDNTFSYITIHITLVAAVACIFSFSGFSSIDSIFESASFFSTLGVSSGITTFNSSPFILWMEIIIMIIARLEIYTVIFGVMRIITAVKDCFAGNR